VPWAGQADPDHFVDYRMATVVGAPVHGVSVVDTATTRESLHEAKTHDGRVGDIASRWERNGVRRQ
jgi:hypothetical protein